MQKNPLQYAETLLQPNVINFLLNGYPNASVKDISIIFTDMITV